MEAKLSQETYHTPCRCEGEVNYSVSLFSKPVQFRLLLDTKPTCNWPAEVDGDGLAYEGPEDNVVCEEQKVEIAFLVARVIVGRGGNAVRDEEKRGKGIGDILGDVGREQFPVCPEDEEEQEYFERRGCC